MLDNIHATDAQHIHILCSTHPPPVVDARPDLPDEGRRADEEEDDGDEAGEVEDGRHYCFVFFS